MIAALPVSPSLGSSRILPGGVDEYCRTTRFDQFAHGLTYVGTV
jgi:hypothetical protein